MTGRGSDWRLVFQRLSGPDEKISILHLRDSICELAGSARIRDTHELQTIISRFDADRDGSLTFPEFEGMLKALLRLPQDSVCGTSRALNERCAHPERYTTRSIWLSSLRNIGGSQVLRGILQPLVAVTAMSALVAAIWGSLALPGGRAGKSLAQMHSLLGGALSLLLVFRTNAAYNRFWEARKIWESVLNRCRDLARFLYLYQEEAGAPRAARLIALLCAFPRELRAHLVGRSILEDLETSLEPPLSNPLMSTGERAERGAHADDADNERLAHEETHEELLRRLTIAPMLPAFLAVRLEQAGNRPLHVCKCLATDFKRIPDTCTFTSRERLLCLSQVHGEMRLDGV